MVNKGDQSEKDIKPIKFKTAPRLLDHIGLAMYSKFQKAISELVVNGYDADATRIDVIVKFNKVIIKDNGFGMDEDDIRDSYMELGSDQKRAVFPRTSIYKRLPIGNKGIGKLAALGIAKAFTIITKKSKHPCFKYTIDRDELNKKRVLEESFINLEKIECKEIKDHGTIIELTNIFPHIKIDTKELKGYLAREIPQNDNFYVYVDGEKCEMKDIPGKKYRVEITNNICGKIEGEVILAKSSFSNIIKPGILTTVRGRVVGDPNLFDVNKGGHKYVRANYITGKVEVIGFDPENSPDKIPVIKTDREGFNTNHPKYQVYNKEMTDLLIKILKQDEKEYYEANSVKKEIEKKHVLENVIQDFREFNQGKKEFSKGVVSSEKGKKDLEVLKLSPVGIKDAKIKLELQKLEGLGNLIVENKTYKLTMRPMGSDDPECRVDDEISVININVDHPAYKQAVETKSIESEVFRAVADAYACKVSKSAQEMYEKVDELIRAHTQSIEKRKKGK